MARRGLCRFRNRRPDFEIARAVGPVAIGKPGATNAGVLAAQMIALADPALAQRLVEYKKKLEEKVEVAAKRLESAG